MFKKSIINQSIIISSSFITLINVNKAYSKDSQLLECSDSISQLKSTNGKEIIIIGTAHISQDSANQVRRIINQVKPNVVMIELDITRIGVICNVKIENYEKLKEERFDIPLFDKQIITQTPIITNNELEIPSFDKQIILQTPIKTNINQILSTISNFANTITTWIRKTCYKILYAILDFPKTIYNCIRNTFYIIGGQLVGFAMGRFYSSVEKLGFKVGDEFKVAYEEAKNVNARILLGDRYCHITLQRIGAAFAATDPTRLHNFVYKFNMLLKDANIDIPKKLNDLFNKDVLLKYIEDLGHRKILNQVMTLLKNELPDVYNALIGERDIYMAKSIIESNANKLVAVVGMAHMTGIENYLINNSNYKLNNNNNKR